MENPQPQPGTTPGWFSRSWSWLFSPCLGDDPARSKVFSHFYFPFFILLDGCQAFVLTMAALNALRRAPEHPGLARDITLLATAELVLAAYHLVVFALGLWLLVHHRQLAAERSVEQKMQEKWNVVESEELRDFNDVIRELDRRRELIKSIQKLRLIEERLMWKIVAWEVAVHPIVKLPCVFIAVPYIMWKGLEIAWACERN